MARRAICNCRHSQVQSLGVKTHENPAPPAQHDHDTESTKKLQEAWPLMWARATIHLHVTKLVDLLIWYGTLRR